MDKQVNAYEPTADTAPLDVEAAVRERYSGASRAAEPELCCAVSYDTSLLKVLPQELIDRDYGCGDPSKHVSPGDTVLDLGSGGGKICYIASQVVGPTGKVIGVDCNDDMLDLARKFQGEISEKIGHDNVTFHKGRIQDLALNLEEFDQYLAVRPLQSSNDWIEALSQADQWRQTRPMIADNSIDVIVSNCVLNLVHSDDRRQLFSEMFRVLKPGGRAVISDIVSDEFVPEHLAADPTLWSGCISGAFQETEFLETFEQFGFYGVEVLTRQSEPWVTVEDIDFRSLTVRVYKGKEGPCLDRRQGVIYRGPWKSVTDDDGHVLKRGVPAAVCDKTFRIYNRPPYQEHVLPVPPEVDVPLEQATPFDCHRSTVRKPTETKLGRSQPSPSTNGTCCGSEGCC